MADPAPVLDPSVRAALQKLADITVPAPMSMMPQTWGWAVLGILVLALLAWGLVRWHRYREANRYRTEALDALNGIERALDSGATPAEALPAIPPLLKRAALAAWPRPQVASLAQSRWIDFLRTSEQMPEIPQSLAALLNDIEYRAPEALAAISPDDARACVKIAKDWIERHRVSA
jgi:Domain of unknown function (DUF4381)